MLIPHVQSHFAKFEVFANIPNVFIEVEFFLKVGSNIVAFNI